MVETASVPDIKYDTSRPCGKHFQPNLMFPAPELFSSFEPSVEKTSPWHEASEVLLSRRAWLGRDARVLTSRMRADVMHAHYETGTVHIATTLQENWVLL